MPVTTCEVCGCRRSCHTCPRCLLPICSDCWHGQGGEFVGHLEAEHAHEIARDSGYEPDYYEEWPE